MIAGVRRREGRGGTRSRRATGSEKRPPDMMFPLSGAEREILRAHWEPVLGDGAHGITKDVPRWRIEDFGPWWWLPTPAALKAMCEAAGFRVRDQGFFWNDNAFTQLLEVE